MSPEYSFRSVGLALAVAGTIACGSGGDTRAPLTVTGPTPAAVSPTPSPSGPPIRLTVTDGWTNAPVPQARVTVGADTMVTDATGQFDVATPAPCLPAAIVATGYLERRVLCLGATEPQGRAAVTLTLWPVTSDAERAALQAFAFRFGRLLRPYELAAEVSPEVVNRGDVAAAWQRAGEAVAAMTGRTFTLRLADVYREGEGAIVAPWSDPASCNHGWFQWQFTAAGFCWENTAEYFVHLVRVAPQLMQNDAVVLRALLYEFGLRPHRLPGLMNELQPANALSDFEVRTLHMIGLRARPFPRGVAWPDTES